jgi:eukaryotic-like serine/threonine-protein kinase
VRQPVPFGKYLLLDRISVGGMAEVFRAKSFGVEGFEKLIAIKRILPSMADDREFLRMFVDEAKIAGQLSHPSIAQIYELGREGSSPYIAMEYVWGKDLLQIYNRFRKLGERMPITMACHVIAKVSEALDYAHRKRDPLGTPLQIVHRDCSPQNILVSYEGEVKVIDFGIAKAASRVSHTNAGVLKGKFAYLSPEQVRGDPVDRRSDLFAIGTVFFECLTGERLFHSESDFTTLERVRDADVPRPRDVYPELPEEIERVVLRALAKDPADRYQHGREMYRDLQAFLRSQAHPYTASALGAWVRKAFPQEMAREGQLLERYRLIGPDGERRASAPIVVSRESAEVILSGRDAVADDVTTEELSGPDEDEGPTLLGGPNLHDLADLPPSGMPSPASLGGLPRHAASSDFADEAPTEVHGEIGIEPRP